MRHNRHRKAASATEIALWAVANTFEGGFDGGPAFKAFDPAGFRRRAMIFFMFWTAAVW